VASFFDSGKSKTIINYGVLILMTRAAKLKLLGYLRKRSKGAENTHGVGRLWRDNI
jgi:hypothetical protein